MTNPTHDDLVALLESIAHSAARQGHGGGWCVAECLMCAELPKIDAALIALKSGAVVLVPAEPTEEMIDEAAQVYPDWHERSLKGIMIGDVCKQLYRAMLACCAKGKKCGG